MRGFFYVPFAGEKPSWFALGGACSAVSLEPLGAGARPFVLRLCPWPSDAVAAAALWLGLVRPILSAQMDPTRGTVVRGE
jgi:hypothetical protein